MYQWLLTLGSRFQWLLMLQPKASGWGEAVFFHLPLLPAQGLLCWRVLKALPISHLSSFTFYGRIHGPGGGELTGRGKSFPDMLGAWPESGTKLHVHVGGALCAFHRHSSMVNTHHEAGPVPLALGCSGASGPDCEVDAEMTSSFLLYAGAASSLTEVTQGVLCSAALVRSFLPVSAYERLPALYCKSLQSKRRPWEPCLICLFGPYTW